MKAKTKFKKMYYKLPSKARGELFLYVNTNSKETYPYSLDVLYREVEHGTKLGKKILKQLGYKED